MPSKSCTKCGNLKPLGEFYNDMRSKDKKKYHCKTCDDKINKKWIEDNRKIYNIRRLEYRNKNREKIILSNRNSQLMKYNIDNDKYDYLLKSQNGVCKICQKTDNRRLSIDHDHKTGEVRGLLCRKCNSALGLLDDNPQVINNALVYLLSSRDGK